MSGPLMKVSLTVSVVGFLAYCYYFDKKRRSDPNFKAKLRAKRKLAQEAQANRFVSDIPIFEDQNEMHEYFMKEVAMGDELLLSGEFEEAAFHLANATVACSQKIEFLGIMEKTLPPTVFSQLVHFYKVANEKFLKKALTQNNVFQMLGNAGSSGPSQFIDNADIE